MPEGLKELALVNSGVDGLSKSLQHTAPAIAAFTECFRTAAEDVLP